MTMMPAVPRALWGTLGRAMQRLWSGLRGVAASGLASARVVSSEGYIARAARSLAGTAGPSSRASQSVSAPNQTLGFAARGAFAPSVPGAVRGKTTGVGVFVGADGDVDRAMRKLKRTMIMEGIEKQMKRRAHYVKGAEQRVIAKRERDHRKWRKAIRGKLGWIVRRKERGF